MEQITSGDTVVVILLFILPIFMGARSCIRRGNGLLAIGVGLFTFSVCNIVSAVIFPIPLFPSQEEPWELERILDFMFQMFSEDYYRFFQTYDIAEYIAGFCNFLLFGFFLCALYRSTRKAWKGVPVVIAVVAFCTVYMVWKEIFYSDMMYIWFDFYNVAIWFAGAFFGYLIALVLSRIFPDFFNNLTLAEWPRQKNRISFKMDLE